MAVTTEEVLMGPGGFSIDIDFTPEIHEELTEVVDGKRRPKKNHMQFFDPASSLVFQGVVLGLTGDEKGLTVTGRGMLWHLGYGEVGPMIRDREYVSGTNKLSNGEFALDQPDLYWRLPSEGSNWLFLPGAATNAGGLGKDDILESDERFPTRPGRSYQVLATGVTGTGRARLRTLYEGKFDPPNLWFNGDLSAGATGWSGNSLAAVINDPANAYDDDTFVIRCLPIPKPQLIPSPGFENGGADWLDVSENPGDMDFVNDPAKAHSGNWVMRCGPVTQKQLLINGGFENGLAFWHTTAITSAGATVEDAVFYHDAPIPNIQATYAAATMGNTGYAVKYLRSDSTNGGGTDPYTVKAGEHYEAEAQVRFAQPGTDGTARLALVYPHPVLEPLYPRWSHSQELHGSDIRDEQFRVVTVSDTVPEGRTRLNILFEVLFNNTGFIAVDEIKCTRTRGNRAKIGSIWGWSIEVDTRYELAAMVRSDADQQVGNVQVGGKLTGATVTDQNEGVDVSSTDFLWQRVAKEIRPATGYEYLWPYVNALDILGAPIWVGSITLTKLDNNRTSIQAGTIVVTPERSYKVRCKVRTGPNLQRGNVRLSMRMIRTDHLPLTVDSPVMDNTNNEWKELIFDITPPSGYGGIEPTLLFTDIEGDNAYVGRFSITDNDTGTVVYDSLSTLDPLTASFSVDTTAPAGAQFVRCQFIAEEGTANWTVEAISLARTGVTPATGNAIIADVLIHPEAGGSLSLWAGAVDCPEPIPYDVEIINRHNRDLLDHYCTVVSDPPREYRVNPDASLDVGVSEDVFTDHTDVVFLDEDIDVEDLPDVESNVEERATHIQLIGAERQTVSGQPIRIEAIAAVPGTTEVDYNGNPIHITKIVSDATVDHYGYAQAYAADLANREAEPALSLSATVTELDTDTTTALGIPERPAFGVGDWGYFYSPDAGLEDRTNPVTIEGQTYFPRRMRVLSRTRSVGPRYRIDVRRTDGTTFNLESLTGIGWSEADATSLTIGDRMPEWEADPQGGAAGQQYIRDRKSRPL